MTDFIPRAAVLEILRTPAASDTFPDMIARVEALEPDGRLDRLRSAAKFLVDRLESFEPDDNDAERMTRDFYGHVVPAHERLMQILAALEPVAQPETPTPGQFTTMCLMIEDVVTGRGFDVDPWQPIETAPKDGLIDIWLADGKRWCDCYYDRICDEWRTSRPSGRLVSVKSQHVTHWMPLPKPPGETTSAIPEEVKAYLRNALVVGGWRGERVAA